MQESACLDRAVNPCPKYYICSQNPFRPSAPAPASDDDFETAVLKKLQREQERRRTLAQDIGNDEDG